jgi:hypothetical protein
MVHSTRSTDPLSYSFSELWFSQCLTRQLLGPRQVFQPHEAVVASVVAQAEGVHLAGEPLVAVEADVDREGEPGLQADMHEAEDGVDLVVVQVQALAWAVDDLEFLGGAVAVNLEGHALFDAAQDPDGSLGDAIALGDGAGLVLETEVVGVDVADLASELLGLEQGGLLEALGDVEAVRGKVLVGDVIGPEVVLQAFVVGQVAQGAAEEEAIEAAEEAEDGGGKALEEGAHGIPRE